MEQKIKHSIFFLLLLVLFIPMFQLYFPVFKENKLDGVYQENKQPTLNISAWLNGTFQDSLALWSTDHFGFRSDLVRVHNQVNYAFSKKVNTEKVIVGKEDYLFETSYINSYLGSDYTSEEHWQKLSARMKAVQDSLAKRNVFMLVAIAPGKGRYLPEYIPEEYGKPAGVNNYTSFIKQLQTLNINHIDYMGWFLQMKNKTQYPLYTKGGIHWSNYGCTLAADSLIKFIRKKGGMNIPQIKINSVRLSEKIENPDNDIAIASNLFFEYPELKLAYADIEYEKNAERVKPDMYVVADSYFWQMYWMGIPKNVFNQVLVSYYNKEIHDSEKDFSEIREPSKIIDLEKNKIILLMVTEANLAGFPWNFLEQMERQLNISKTISMEEILAEEAKIRSDSAWLQSVAGKARERNISLDSMIRLDAIWMIENAK